MSTLAPQAPAAPPAAAEPRRDADSRIGVREAWKNVAGYAAAAVLSVAAAAVAPPAVGAPTCGSPSGTAATT